MTSPRHLAGRWRIGPLELLIATVVVLLAVVLFVEHSYTSRTFDAARSWGTASSDLRVSITESHLWLEERLSGDRSVDVQRQVFGNIDVARAQCQALVQGGEGYSGIQQLPSEKARGVQQLPPGEARRTTAETCREILSLRAAAAERLRVGANDVGQPADQSYDAAFGRILDLSRTGEKAAERHVDDRHSATDLVNAAAILALFVLLGAIIILVRRHQARVARLAAGNQSILNAAGDGIYGLDAEGVTTFANPAAARLTGHEVEELLGRRSHELVHHSRADGTPYPVEECPAFESVRTGTFHRSDRDVYWRKDGTSFPVEYTSTPIVEKDRVTGAVVVFKDITERREVERAKDEFTSVVSHELRTPLTSIRGSLGLLESGVLGPLPEKGQRMVEIAVQNTDRLVRLINDILDIERIDSGQIDMNEQRCDAAELIGSAIESVEQFAAEAQVKLTAGAQPAALYADPDRVLQTLTNLISNAVKFSPEGAAVQVRSERRDGEVLFEVKDQGRGIPADKLDSIFGRFQQVDASDSREKGGTGLGLAICRTIVEHHGGRIWVESEPGVGSTFSFVLPARQVNGSAPDPEDASRPSVLVCDDDASVVEVVATMLRQRGYRVIPTHSGEEALERAISERPDAILLDLLMPGMSGWETAAALKQHADTSEIPIVILSVLAETESEAPGAPVVGWLEKPLDERALFEALDRAVSLRGEPFKVLIVEDDPDLAAILMATFERHGIETFHATDGRRAIELSQRLLPDLLVLDIGLPEADGFEVVDWLRRHELLSALPMVVYTARELDDHDRERLRLGEGTEFLTKGRITPQDFEQRVMDLLQRLTKDETPEMSDEPEAHPVGVDGEPGNGP